MDAEAILAEYSERVDGRLHELLPPESRAPPELHAAMRYSCLAPGKRLRPALCLACAEATAIASDAVLDAACAVEMVHCFSLIHDDLPAIDDDHLRRGLPTCHIKFGEALAVLAGDALFALAFQTLAEATPSAREVAIMARAAGSDGLVGGEVLDVLSEGRSTSGTEIDLIHSRKTGALVSAACEIGALLAGASDNEAARCREYGWHLGLAFQITDDLLNELSTADALGKAAGSDRHRRKATYPAIHGIEGSREAARNSVDRALQALGDMPNGTQSLRALASYAVDRLR